MLSPPYASSSMQRLTSFHRTSRGSRAQVLRPKMAFARNWTSLSVLQVRLVMPGDTVLAIGTANRLPTGYDYSWQFCFPVIGRSATSLQEKWADHPRTYLSLCVDDFPNFFMALGPNSGVSSGSQLAVVERQIDYMVEVTRKLQRDRLKSIEVDSGAVKDFHEYIKVRPYTLYCIPVTVSEMHFQCYFPKVNFEHNRYCAFDPMAS